MATKGNNTILAVDSRLQIGTTSANALRKAGKVPAVLFGHGVDPMPVSLDAKAFAALLHAGGKSRVLHITSDGSKKDTALVREVQRDPITRRVVHAALQRVSESETVSASLPIVTVGVADGGRNMGCVMDIVVHTLEVEGPANAIPPNIEIDVSELGLHDH